MKRRRKLLLFAGFTGALIIPLFAWLFEGFFNSSHICTTCGRMKSTTRTFWIPISNIEDTELSRFHDDYKGDDGHSHTWMFAGGSGGAILCALGRGRTLLPAVRNEDTRFALELIRKKKGDQAVDDWLKRLLNPQLSHDAYFALKILTEESTGFESRYQEAEEFYSMSQPSPN